LDPLEDLIRSRRTHKSFGPDPVPRETLDELLELARWAPNHHRTNPWRFRVVGPQTLARLKVLPVQPRRRSSTARRPSWWRLAC
jgi:nitroreductase